MKREPPKTMLLIREHRKRCGMTLKDLAEAVGSTPQTMQRLETENMTVSLVWLDKIAAAMGTTASALLGSSQESEPITSESLFARAMMEELGRNRYHFPTDPQLVMRTAKAFGELSDALLDWQIGVAKWDKVSKAAVRMAALAARISLDGDKMTAKQIKQRDAVTTDHEEAAA